MADFVIALIDALHFVAMDRCVANSPGTEKPCVRVAQDLPDPQLLSDGAGVLASGAAERDQAIVSRIVAFGDGDRANCPNDIGVGDITKACCNFFVAILNSSAHRPMSAMPYKCTVCGNGCVARSILSGNKFVART